MKNRIGILFLVLVIAMAGIGTGYSSWNESLDVDTTGSTGCVGLTFINCEPSDPAVPETPDLGNEPVNNAWCDYSISADGNTLNVNVYNAYPEYQCIFSNITVQNVGNIPMKITSSSVTYVSDPVVELQGFWTTSLVGMVFDPFETVSGDLWLYITPEATQDTVYTFTIEIVGEQESVEPEPEDLGGTIGFWKNWNCHKTYTEEQIDNWLQNIDTESSWLVPDVDEDGVIEADDMKEFLKDYTKATMEDKFRAQYLATRLDIESGRLSMSLTHDVTSIDYGNYLGLADPADAALSEIVSAIEGATPSTDDQYEILKDICDALNNLWI